MGIGVGLCMDKYDEYQYSVTIDRPRQELYEYWRDFENLPQFSPHLNNVRTIGANRSEWSTDGPTGPVTWIAEMTVDKPGEVIGWNTVEGSDVEMHGVVKFQDAPQGRGTEVSVYIKLKAPWGPIGKFAAKATGNSPDQEVEEMLRRFKTLMESGEVPVVEGQPSNQMRGDNMPGDDSARTGFR